MMMMSATTSLETAAPSKLKENLWYWLGQWPSTGIFNALNVKNLSLLLTMGLLSRGLGISMARILSDYPDWNHAKQYDVGIDHKTGKETPIDPHTAEINRRRNFLERIFIEFVGTIMASYVFLQTSQDITAKILETAFKDKLKPENLINAAKKLENPLSADELAKFESVLKTAFGRDKQFKGMGIDDAKHVIYSKIYGDGNLYKISENLKANKLGHLLTLKEGAIDHENSLLGKEFEQQWGLLNPLGVATVLVGAVGSAWLSGAPVQWANDTLFRDEGMPTILNWWNQFSSVDNAVKKRQKKYPHTMAKTTTPLPVTKPFNVVSTATPIDTSPVTPMQSLPTDDSNKSPTSADVVLPKKPLEQSAEVAFKLNNPLLNKASVGTYTNMTMMGLKGGLL
jgi:hypothetical protein